MSTWSKNTASVRDNGFGRSRGGKRIEGAVLHHGAGLDVLDYVANANSRDSHPTYHVNRDGRVTGIVHPDRRPFSTGHSVDSVAITFEMDNSATGGNWPVSDATLSAAIDVCVDHARQAGLTKFAKNTPGSDQPGVFFIAWHSQYASTACPGPHVLSRMDWIVAECQRRLNGGSPAPSPAPAPAPSAWAFNPPAAALQARIQQALKNRGRYSGPVDGVWGPNTIKGIQRTASNVGYDGPVDGVPGSNTCYFVQVYAQRFGDYAGPIDRVLGPNGWAGFALGLERP